MNGPKKPLTPSQKETILKILRMDPQKRERFLRIERLRRGLPMISSKQIQPREEASIAGESANGHAARGWPHSAPYSMPAEGLVLGDDRQARTYSPSPPYLVEKPEPAGAGEDMQPFGAEPLIGRVDADDPQLGGGVRSDGPEAPRPPTMWDFNQTQGRSRWKGWMIAAAVIAGLLGLVEWLRPSDAELARRQISTLEGELKVRHAERIEHAARCQALAVVNGEQMAQACLQNLRDRFKLDSEDGSRINQQIKRLQVALRDAEQREASPGRSPGLR